jgi:hypothetical protein
VSETQRPAWTPSWPALGLTLAIATTASGAIWGLAQSSARNEQTATALTGLRIDMVRGVEAIAQQIRELPDLNARLNLVERLLREGDARDGAQQGAIDQIRQKQYELNADMDALKRASSVSLPGRPGIGR